MIMLGGLCGGNSNSIINSKSNSSLFGNVHLGGFCGLNRGENNLFIFK